jgi:hypothetical protein
MKSFFRTLSLLTVMILSTGFIRSDRSVPECNFYSYVVYGNAMVNGKLHDLESVYKGFKIYKSSENFFACLDSYGRTKAGEFTVINIGPYETESVIYQEINRIRKDLEDKGYKEFQADKHTLIAVLISGNKPCK